MVDLMITRVEAALANKDMPVELTPATKGLRGRRGTVAGRAAAAPHDPARDLLIGDVEGLDDRLHRSIRSSSFAQRSSRISCGINPL